MKLTIDTRENTQLIRKLLEGKQLEIEVKQLTIGDFILNDTVIFERKTLADFISSIKDKRLFRQSYKSLQSKQPYILILEGLQKDIKQTQMSRKAVQGAMVYLSVFMGIPTLRSVNFKETLSLILMTGQQEEKASYYRRTYLNHQKAGKNNEERLKLQVLQNLPGIGKQRAEDILHEFGSLKTLFNATEKELRAIQGIGKKTAQSIIKLIG